jgi:hypothetical protein
MEQVFFWSLLVRLIFGQNITTIKRNAGVLLDDINVVGLGEMAEKTKCMWIALQ